MPIPLPPRQAVLALGAAFVVGTVGGGFLLSGGGSSASGTLIPFNPAAEEAAAAEVTPTPKPKGAFTVEAIEEGKRIVLTGDGAEPGAKLVVQRKEAGGWQDFPATATAAGDGSYSTYIITSRDGTFRLKDTESETASEPVKVER